MNPPMDLEWFKGPDVFGGLLGYQLVAADKDRREARLTLRVEERHLSPSGKAHGGVLTALLDAACGVAVCTTLGEGEVCSTVEIKVNFFKPVSLGDRLVAEAKVAFRGKKLCAPTATVVREGETEPVAMATATFNVAKL